MSLEKEKRWCNCKIEANSLPVDNISFANHPCPRFFCCHGNQWCLTTAGWPIKNERKRGLALQVILQFLHIPSLQVQLFSDITRWMCWQLPLHFLFCHEISSLWLHKTSHVVLLLHMWRRWSFVISPFLFHSRSSLRFSSQNQGTIYWCTAHARLILCWCHLIYKCIITAGIRYTYQCVQVSDYILVIYLYLHW